MKENRLVVERTALRQIYFTSHSYVMIVFGNWRWQTVFKLVLPEKKAD